MSKHILAVVLISTSFLVMSTTVMAEVIVSPRNDTAIDTDKHKVISSCTSLKKMSVFLTQQKIADDLEVVQNKYNDYSKYSQVVGSEHYANSSAILQQQYQYFAKLDMNCKSYNELKAQGFNIPIFERSGDKYLVEDFK